MEPGGSGAEKCFCGGWSSCAGQNSNHRYYSYSYTELIGVLLQGAPGTSLLQATGYCCLAGLLIGCRGRMSVAARPLAAPWIAKAARYPIRAHLFPLTYHTTM